MSIVSPLEECVSIKASTRSFQYSVGCPFGARRGSDLGFSRRVRKVLSSATINGFGRLVPQCDQSHPVHLLANPCLALVACRLSLAGFSERAGNQ